MKKLYSLLFSFSFSVFALTSTAANVPVGVGFNGSAAANAFFPSAVTANVGDVIQFTLISGSHNVNGTVMPSGAPVMTSGPTNMSTPGQQYNYTVMVAGNYTFVCTSHPGMTGTMTVSSVGILDPAVDMLTQVYPNPFKDKLTVKYSGINKIEFFNIVGEAVRSINIDAQEGKQDVDVETLPSGVYFFRTYKDGNIVETRKIVKTK